MSLPCLFLYIYVNLVSKHHRRLAKLISPSLQASKFMSFMDSYSYEEEV